MARRTRTEKIIITNTETGINCGHYEMSEARVALMDLEHLHRIDLRTNLHPRHKVEVINAYWNEDGTYSHRK